MNKNGGLQCPYLKTEKNFRCSMGINQMQGYVCGGYGSCPYEEEDEEEDKNITKIDTIDTIEEKEMTRVFRVVTKAGNEYLARITPPFDSTEVFIKITYRYLGGEVENEYVQAMISKAVKQRISEERRKLNHEGD